MKKLNSLLPSRAIAAAIALSAGFAFGGDFYVRATGVCKPDWQGNFITNQLAGAETKFCAYVVDESTYDRFDGDHLGIYQAWLDDEFENAENKVGKDWDNGQPCRLGGGFARKKIHDMGGNSVDILDFIEDYESDTFTCYIIFVLSCSTESESGSRDYYIARAVNEELDISELVEDPFNPVVIDLLIDPATDKWHYIGEDAAAKATLLFGF